MKEYDKIGQVWIPYLMYFHTANYSSDVLNTDSRGFRISYKSNQKISDFSGIKNYPSCLLVGGSFVFGVGATNDKNTIASRLNSITNYTWFNFGGRAFSSTQELLLFLFYYQQIGHIKKIIMLSGLNNLILYYLSQRYSKELGSFFFQGQYNKKMNSIFMSKKQRLMEAILHLDKKLRQDFSVCEIEEINSGNISKGSKEDLLCVLKRDILIFKVLSDYLGAKLYYVLQPVASWVDKKLSNEENALFAELDARPENQWKILKTKIDFNQYGWFLAKIKDICNLNNISFFDLNEAMSKKKLDNKWIFVDRAHCTDEGYELVTKILEEQVVNI